MALIDKLRKSREIVVEVGDYLLTVRRPTDLEMIKVRASGTSASLLPFVIGWARKDGADFTEFDLGLPGAEPHLLTFDAETCTEWLSDRLDLFSVVQDKIVDAYAAHTAAVADARKN